jgi:hypothetical protein
VTADDAEYPDELAAWVEKLEEREWQLSRARARAGDGTKDTIAPLRVPDFVLAALASGVIGNLGYDLIKAMLKAWRRPRVRLPEQARDVRDAVLIAMLATQARCAQVGLPMPGLGDLEATECQRLPDRWRVELRRRDRNQYLHGVRPWPDGTALAASVLIPDIPLKGTDIQVTVVARPEVDAAEQTNVRRARQWFAE